MDKLVLIFLCLAFVGTEFVYVSTHYTSDGKCNYLGTVLQFPTNQCVQGYPLNYQNYTYVDGSVIVQDCTDENCQSCSETVYEKDTCYGTFYPKQYSNEIPAELQAKDSFVISHKYKGACEEISGEEDYVSSMYSLILGSYPCEMFRGDKSFSEGYCDVYGCKLTDFEPVPQPFNPIQMSTNFEFVEVSKYDSVECNGEIDMPIEGYRINKCIEKKNGDKTYSMQHYYMEENSIPYYTFYQMEGGCDTYNISEATRAGFPTKMEGGSACLDLTTKSYHYQFLTFEEFEKKKESENMVITSSENTCNDVLGYIKPIREKDCFSSSQLFNDEHYLQVNCSKSTNSFIINQNEYCNSTELYVVSANCETNSSIVADKFVELHCANEDIYSGAKGIQITFILVVLLFIVIN